MTRAGDPGQLAGCDDAVMVDGAGRGPWMNRVDRRRERIRLEIERNRRGEYTVPTWVLVVALVAVVLAWVLVVLLA